MDLKSLLKAQWDRATAIGCTVLGAILLLVGWVGVSGTPFLAEQAPYILSGGVGGIFLLGVGATLWISADLRDEWRKLDRIEAALKDGTLRFVDGPSKDVRQPSAPVDAYEDEPYELQVAELAPAGISGHLQDADVLGTPVKPVRAARSASRSEVSSSAVRPKRSRAGVEHA